MEQLQILTKNHNVLLVQKAVIVLVEIQYLIALLASTVLLGLAQVRPIRAPLAPFQTK
jgi:hypothetical protein